MQKVDRRSFLRVVAGTALAGFSFFYPGIGSVLGSTLARPRPSLGVAAAAGAPNVQRMIGPDPTFAGGKVVAKTSEGVILQSAAGVRAVRIPAGTVVWKGSDMTPDAIQLQDWVDVKGTPLEDGSLLARSEWIWVNIGRREGVVKEVSPGAVTLKHNKGTERIEVAPTLEVIRTSDGAPHVGGIAALKPGTQIGAVGLRLPGGGFRATRIWF